LRVPTGTHTNGIARAAAGQRGQVLTWGEDDGLDPHVACPLGQPRARRLAVTGPGVDEQHGPDRRIGEPPAIA
jgi:hypothetical protein